MSIQVCGFSHATRKSVSSQSISSRSHANHHGTEHAAA